MPLGHQGLGHGKAYDACADNRDFSGNMMDHRAPVT
jgi:hypothetical protein